MTVAYLQSAPIRSCKPMERHTRQRTAIEDALKAAGRPLSPQEVLEAAQASVPALGMATVYRQLKALQDEALVQLVVLPGENPRYELSTHHHHHHFQCRQCSRVFDIHACPGDFADLAPSGFAVERHELTLYGLCDACGAPPKPAAKARRAPKPVGRT